MTRSVWCWSRQDNSWIHQEGVQVKTYDVHSGAVKRVSKLVSLFETPQTSTTGEQGSNTEHTGALRSVSTLVNCFQIAQFETVHKSRNTTGAAHRVESLRQRFENKIRSGCQEESSGHRKSIVSVSPGTSNPGLMFTVGTDASLFSDCFLC